MKKPLSHSEVRQRLRLRFDSLASLKPGWDGYGGKTIPPDVLEAARSLAAALEPRPEMASVLVVPLSRGSIQFEWHQSGRTLEMEFVGPEYLDVLRWHPRAGVEEEECCLVSETDRVVGHLDWFSGDPSSGPGEGPSPGPSSPGYVAPGVAGD